MKKRKNNKYTGIYNDSKLIAKASLWVIVVVAIIFYIARYIYNDAVGITTGQTHFDKSLIEVSIPQHIPNIHKSYLAFDTYFNPETHQPNCVSYELLGSETDGEEPRAKSFSTDYEMDGCPDTRDYTNSGYDRGHMAPAGDMKWNKTAMEQSFLLTNICPQHKSLNTGIWHRLEKRAREWAVRDSAIIVVCGPIFDNQSPKRIGEIGVAIPDRFFKAFYAPARNRTIAFIFNNAKTKGELQQYAVSIDSIEKLTKFDLFHTLPDSLENIIESNFNYKLWQQR